MILKKTQYIFIRNFLNFLINISLIYIIKNLAIKKSICDNFEEVKEKLLITIYYIYKYYYYIIIIKNTVSKYSH